MSTVFDSVVRSENDHTNLLRNLMARHPRVAASVLNCLTGQNISEVEAATFQINTQRAFSGDDGREIPDIVVEGANFRCLIEAKIDPFLSLTSGQADGYRRCSPPYAEYRLVFLVPSAWKHTTAVENIAPPPNCASARIIFWQDLLVTLDEIAKGLEDAVLTEAVEFLKGRFKMTSMTSAEKDVLTAWKGEKLSAIRKLELTIRQSKALFDAHDFTTEPEFERDLDGCGFYIKQGSKYRLWVGTWVDSPTALSFGYHRTENSWLKPDKLPPGSMLSVEGSHNLWPLEEQTWDKPQQVYETVIAFLAAYEAS